MKKGYIGALGDDFPALFPILLGLLLFFGSITLTYQVYELRSKQINAMRANVMLSRAVRTQRQFTGNYWNDYACPLLQSSRSNYGVHTAMILNRTHYDTYDKQAGSYSLDNDFVTFEDTNTIAICTENSLPPAGPGHGTPADWKNDVPHGEATESVNYVSMEYPVVVEVNTAGGKQFLTAELILVTWQ